MTTTFLSVSTSNRESSKEPNMTAHLRGPGALAGAKQTLYVMNPSYAGYSDASNVGDMVLVSPPTGLDEGNTLSSSIQQHFIGFPVPCLLQNSLSLQSAAVSPILASTIDHQLSNCNTNQACNSWNGQNELPYINDIAQASQSITARLFSVNSGQQAASGFPHYSVSHQSLAPLQDQSMSLFQNNDARCLNLDNANQVCSAPDQGLSLSLSARRPFHMQINESSNSQCTSVLHSDGNSNGQEGHTNLSSFHAPSRVGTLRTGYHNVFSGTGCSRPVHLESGTSTVTGRFLANSKYLKAVQQLLVEVVSFGRDIKNSSIKGAKARTWMGTSSVFDGPFSKYKLPFDTQDKNGTANVASCSEQTNENVIELTPSEKQELQMKKAKLVEMLEEVDQRYKQYYSKLRIVVSSFESAVGFGAARTYTGLALQTISRHFRCLRDTIAGEVRTASKALGEEDPVAHGNGEISRLFFVNQQLHEQRTLQQFGMMQQHPWRPQRGLPEHAVSILRAWLFEHFLHPYPKDADKMMLAKQTGLTRNQVSNWFINARVRLWKPMVEEMYIEETREAEVETGVSENKVRAETTKNASKDSTINSSLSGDESHQSHREVKIDAKQKKIQDHNLSDLIQNSQNMTLAGAASNSHLIHDESLGKGVNKCRNHFPGSLSTISPSMSKDIEMRLHDNHIEGIENKLNIEERCYRNNFMSTNGGIMHADNLDSFGSYTHVGGMNTRYPGNRNVSLTLGLQHCDGLSLSGQGRKHYLHNQSIQVGRQEDSGNEFNDYYNLNENTIGQGSTYETMNIYNQKRLATQFLQRDFVA